METLNVMHASSGDTASLIISALVMIVTYLIIVVRSQRIKIAFYKINSMLSNSSARLNCVFAPVQKIPIRKIKVANQYSNEGSEINESLLDAYINNRIDDANSLRRTFDDIEAPLEVEDKKRQITRELITDSIGRIDAAKLAYIYTNCSYKESDGISDFKKEKALIIRIVRANTFGDNNRSNFLRSVMNNFTSMTDDPGLTEDAQIIIRADEAKFRMANHDDLFKSLIPEMSVDK